MKTVMTLIVCIAAVALAACSEKPQTLGSKQDAHASTGVGASQYKAPNWKASDKNAWEQQLKTRSQGQNDYSRAN